MWRFKNQSKNRRHRTEEENKFRYVQNKRHAIYKCIDQLYFFYKYSTNENKKQALKEAIIEIIFCHSIPLFDICWIELSVLQSKNDIIKYLANKLYFLQNKWIIHDKCIYLNDEHQHQHQHQQHFNLFNQLTLSTSSSSLVRHYIRNDFIELYFKKYYECKLLKSSCIEKLKLNKIIFSS